MVFTKLLKILNDMICMLMIMICSHEMITSVMFIIHLLIN